MTYVIERGTGRAFPHICVRLAYFHQEEVEKAWPSKRLIATMLVRHRQGMGYEQDICAGSDKQVRS